MLGSHVARSLVQRGDEVHGLVRWRSNLHNLAGILEDIHLHTGDIQEDALVRKLIRKSRAEVIYHFAAQAFNGVSWDSPRYTLTVNIFGTLNILEALREENNTTTRVLMGCSSAEYGETAQDRQGSISESAPLQPVTPYGVSKVTQELLGKQYFSCYGIPVIIARIFNQVGTGHTESAAIQEFCRQIAMIEAGLQEPVLQVGYLDTKRDFTDIRDSAPVLVKLSEIGTPGQVYNLCSGHAVSMRELLELAITLSTARISVETDESRMRPYDENILLGDNSKICQLTGWKPTTDIRKSVQDILDYWRVEIGLRYPKSGR
jgi:GDP-4-dehydro-6-deoxy-D-mannose reductase